MVVFMAYFKYYACPMYFNMKNLNITNENTVFQECININWMNCFALLKQYIKYILNMTNL